MKKFLGILAITGALVACNNSATSTDNTQDSLDSVASAQKDTTQANADQTKDSITLANQAAKDSAAAADSANHK